MPISRKIINSVLCGLIIAAASACAAPRPAPEALAQPNLQKLPEPGTGAETGCKSDAPLPFHSAIRRHDC